MTINAPPPPSQGTQTIEKDEIWSTILTGVASSKMVPTKKLIVLGNYIYIYIYVILFFFFFLLIYEIQ
jgi:hypothetical protein